MFTFISGLVDGLRDAGIQSDVHIFELMMSLITARLTNGYIVTNAACMDADQSFSERFPHFYTINYNDSAAFSFFFHSLKEDKTVFGDISENNI